MPESADFRTRVRPMRFALLVKTDASADDLHLCVELLSCLWGGEFGVILTTGDHFTALAQQSLTKLLPDIVLGISMTDVECHAAIGASCFPLAVQRVTRESWKANGLWYAVEPIGVGSVLNQLTKDNPRIDQSRVTLWQVPDDCPYHLYAAYANGLPPHLDVQELAVTVLAGTCAMLDKSSTLSDFIRLCAAQRGRWTWGDVTSYRVTGTSHSGDGHIPPTVFLVENPTIDLPAYWNMRTLAGLGAPSTLIPLPLRELQADASKEALVDWIKRHTHSNYIYVTSRSASASVCNTIAANLQTLLSGSSIKHVDVRLYDDFDPTIQPVHRTTISPVMITDRQVAFSPASPSIIQADSEFGGEWMIDLLANATTGRSPMDLLPPVHRAAIDVLRAPNPSNIRIAPTHNVGIQHDAITVRCSSREERVQLVIPSDSELLPSLLEHSGWDLRLDDKRQMYEGSIKVFGEMDTLARCMTGSAGLVLFSFETSGIGDLPLTANRIKQILKSGKFEPRNEDALLTSIFNRLPPLSKNVAQRRFDEYLSKDVAHSDSIEHLLEKWARHRIVVRLWSAGKCEHCGLSCWRTRLDVDVPLFCDGCSAQLEMPSQVVVGYKLNPTLKRSLSQGMKPVVLTARILRGLTTNAFSWLPGVAGTFKGMEADLDLVACCDGELVFGECKTFESTPLEARGWDDAETQLARTVDIARQSGVRAVVLAAMTEAWPSSIETLAASQSDDHLKITLINKHSLESGILPKDSEGQYSYLHDLFPKPNVSQRKPSGRTMSIFGGSLTQST